MFQTAYSEKVKPVLEGEEGLTEQSHKKECDMNYILRNYAKTGIVRHAKTHEGRYDDVTAADFQEAMFLVKEVQNMFETLPAQYRAEFENNPSKFLEFTQNPNNLQKMAEMGIIQGNDGLKLDGVTASGAPTKEDLEKGSEPPPAA